MIGRDFLGKLLPGKTSETFRPGKGPHGKCYGTGLSVEGLTDTRRVGRWSFGRAVSPLMKPDE